MHYSICMLADFQNALISRIFGVFRAFFCAQLVYMSFRVEVDSFFGILIFDAK